MLSSILSNITDLIVHEGNGVKDLVDMGLETLPKQYVQLAEERITTSMVIVDDTIPVIDMSDWGSDPKPMEEKNKYSKDNSPSNNVRNGTRFTPQAKKAL
nr:feruloyl CoA ortho-hydroxylase 1-like [Ipomoea trifida]